MSKVRSEAWVRLPRQQVNTFRSPAPSLGVHLTSCVRPGVQLTASQRPARSACIAPALSLGVRITYCAWPGVYLLASARLACGPAAGCPAAWWIEHHGASAHVPGACKCMQLASSLPSFSNLNLTVALPSISMPVPDWLNANITVWEILAQLPGMSDTGCVEDMRS
eukprot:scaffold37244_cov20-Tisochrysis_lutea.AAC.3